MLKNRMEVPRESLSSVATVEERVEKLVINLIRTFKESCLYTKRTSSLWKMFMEFIIEYSQKGESTLG